MSTWKPAYQIQFNFVCGAVVEGILVNTKCSERCQDTCYDIFRDIFRVWGTATEV